MKNATERNSEFHNIEAMKIEAFVSDDRIVDLNDLSSDYKLVVKITDEGTEMNAEEMRKMRKVSNLKHIVKTMDGKIRVT